MEWREGDRDIGYGCGVVDKEEDEDFGCIALTQNFLILFVRRIYTVVNTPS